MRSFIDALALLINKIKDPQHADAIALRAANETLRNYHEAPTIYDWHMLDTALAQLQKYKGRCSNDTSNHIGEFVTHVHDGRSAYDNAIRYIRQWCNTALPLLRVYLAIPADKKSEAKKSILASILENASAQMKQAQNDLKLCAKSISDAIGKLTTIEMQSDVRSFTQLPVISEGLSGFFWKLLGAIKNIVVVVIAGNPNHSLEAFKNCSQSLAQGLHLAKVRVEVDRDNTTNIKAATDAIGLLCDEDLTDDVSANDEIYQLAGQLKALCEAYKSHH